MKITIRVVEETENGQAGDWKLINGRLEVYVKSSGDERSDFLVGLHEMIEAFLCQQAGVHQKDVDQWDARNQDALEPGALPGSPYYSQHVFAEIVERLTCLQMGYGWEDHEKQLDA